MDKTARQAITLKRTIMNKYIKRISALVCITFISLVFHACKDFLNVVPKDKLTGNNFFQSKDDVEANITKMYSDFFEKINESHVIGAIGEYRSGEVFRSPEKEGDNARLIVEVLGQNNLLYAIDGGAPWGWYNLAKITNWTQYYRVIQAANILIDKLEEGIPNLEESDTRRYLGEATFIRCFTYFWMVRLYGDVVYYTTAYQADPLPRMPMVEVLNNCIADMKSKMEGMPWTNSDPAQRGARASRGSAAALVMHMNMWNAGFDKNNRNKYYEETAAFGDQLIKSGAYQLLPMTVEGWSQVVKGRSPESLFEFFRSINYDDNNEALAPFGDHFLRWPYKFPRYNNNNSMAYFNSFYMNTLYPADVADLRKTIWYEDMLSNSGRFLILKYAYNTYASGNEDRNPDNTFLIFRYADAILLRAEALAELDQDAAAIEALNMIRDRAEAPVYDGGGGAPLKTFIFLERARELLGEGHRYFDLVRTGRIMNAQFSRRPMTLDQYTRRAWTWPIDQSARNNNPLMSLNEFWTTGGI